MLLEVYVSKLKILLDDLNEDLIISLNIRDI